MYAAATGMAAQQQSLDVIADNLANADVAGFKSAQATFAAIGGNAQLGTASTGVHSIFAQGKLMKSGGPFDLAIDGAGFFAVERDGRLGFTRAGSFSRRADGALETPDGWKLRGLRLPSDAQSARVDADGRVTVVDGGGAARPVGRVGLMTFDAPEKLRPAGSAVFAQTQESGRPRPLCRWRWPTEDCVRDAREIQRLDRRVDDGDLGCATRVRSKFERSASRR